MGNSHRTLDAYPLCIVGGCMEWLTIAHVAAIKGCHPDTVRRAIRRGAFPVEVLNPDAPSPRREIRIPPSRQLDLWQPRRKERE